MSYLALPDWLAQEFKLEICCVSLARMAATSLAVSSVHLEKSSVLAALLMPICSVLF